RPRTCSGSTAPMATSHTTRAAMVSVLPAPAPATTSAGCAGAAITAACSSVGDGRPSAAATSCGLTSCTGTTLGRRTSGTETDPPCGRSGQPLSVTDNEEVSYWSGRVYLGHIDLT